MFVTESSTENFAKSEAGGKGYNLYLMSQPFATGLSFPHEKLVRIPEWVVLGKSYFLDFLQHNQIQTTLAEILQNFTTETFDGKTTESQILNLFEKTPHTEHLKSSLQKALRQLPPGPYSVRSSASDEDGSAHSFAGQLSTFLYVHHEEEILRSIKLCWASGFSERGLSYRKENSLDFEKISVAVVLQKMIDPTQSGVLFTCDPVAQKMDSFVISSVYGVGEGLVSGLLEADTFWIDSSNGKCLHSDIVDKKTSLRQNSEVATEENIRKKASLDEKELMQLWRIGKTIYEKFHTPQDIEWAIDGDKYYVLQTRPITSIEYNLIGYPNLWDNSNIIESYGGITLPLSFSFALRNYKAVYVQFCEVLGVPSAIIKEMDSYLSYMLGHIHGRVYYNLFNWYKLVGVLPGFKQNREFMETMMGVTESLSEEITERIKPHPSWDTFSGKIRKFISGLNFLKYHFTIQSLVNDFLHTFNRDYNRYRSLPLKHMRGDELIRVYMDIETNMLGRWKAPIINDFLCMVHFGLLRKLTLKWLDNADSTLQNDLLSGEGGLESAQPMKELLKLSRTVLGHPELRLLFEQTKAEHLMEALNQSPFTDFFSDIKKYIDQYGFRCMSEMKLEEIDIVTDPTYLFVCIKNYLKTGLSCEVSEQDDKKIRRAAEEKVTQNLTGIKKWIYFWVLHHARKAVKNRENTRFARTRIYGVARTIFQNIGEDLNRLGILSNARDIFWLSMEEVFGIYNGTLSDIQLQKIVEAKKTTFAQYDKDPDPRILTRGAVYWKNQLIKDVEIPNFEGEDFDLKGLPCCPGIIEGPVKVISSPQDNLILSGEILVADRTDPGWVPLYPSIRGLLVERGSLLSHSAIVAREMGIPTIVSIPGLTKVLKTGMTVRLDGKAGTVKILSDPSSDHLNDPSSDHLSDSSDVFSGSTK